MNTVAFDPEDPFRDVELPESADRPPRPLVRLEGWRDFVSRQSPRRPEIPTIAEFERLPKDDAKRKSFATARKRYHSAFGPIETNWLDRVHLESLQLAAMNYNSPPGARPGVVLNGLGTVGKSTIATELGRKYERSLRKKLGRPLDEAPKGPLFVPVIYVTLPGGVTIKSFDRLILGFLGIPSPKRDTEADLIAAVIDHTIECCVSLIIIDDIHFLKMKNRSADDINNHLKSLASAISATFVFAGIDVDGSGFLTEGHSKERAVLSQTSHRFRRYDIVPFAKDSDEFRQLLGAFDANLCLMKHEPGTLLQMRQYIHGRTNGYIGAISALIRLAANAAIDDGEEALTQSRLDHVLLDDAAEQHRATVTGKK